ncbi:hypothetical protein [Roseisalinus antarcticus]|uniref:Uncharacterized protein n=1 Tax=Roseisalinus antarcticus TaxID=254357 RepID=A0A1Y5TYN2_9RHOB|nr:hypothetical protein [Roseisalinus antarcticus]SLN71732.1 hypothetical protein ROA7023_03539 [Roseisalinus antarcticus]
MTLLEEMEGKPRPTPGLLKTIESVMSIVRESREGASGKARNAEPSMDAEDLAALFRQENAQVSVQTPARPGNLSPEEQEARDLATIRKALYSV